MASASTLRCLKYVRQSAPTVVSLIMRQVRKPLLLSYQVRGAGCLISVSRHGGCLALARRAPVWMRQDIWTAPGEPESCPTFVRSDRTHGFSAIGPAENLADGEVSGSHAHSSQLRPELTNINLAEMAPRPLVTSDCGQIPRTKPTPDIRQCRLPGPVALVSGQRPPVQLGLAMRHMSLYRRGHSRMASPSSSSLADIPHQLRHPRWALYG
jgi:hypothetical protein